MTRTHNKPSFRSPTNFEKELLTLNPLQSRMQTRKDVANYIENYYKLIRRHSHLDYVSPIEFETNGTHLI